MAIVTILGPRDAGPGERALVFQKVAEFLGDEPPTRIDVPAKGSTGDGEGRLREGVAEIVPALQSGSLFGGATPVLLVDAQHLLRAEAEIVAELVEAADPSSTALVVVSAGPVPAPLGKVLRTVGEVVEIPKLRERDAAAWLAEAAKARGLRLEGPAAAILLQRFGTDLAALGQALDQLAVLGRVVDVDTVRERFTNRPEEPVWLLTDAIVAGREAEALRRLADYLEHAHPLALLASLEGEIRRRALAQVAPDFETLAGWVGSSRYPVKKAWEARNRTRAAGLARALDAIARADLALKREPEATHRVTMERLTVALSRWLGR